MFRQITGHDSTLNFFPRAQGRRFRRLRISIAGCGQVGEKLLEQFTRCHFNACQRASPHAEERKRVLRGHGARVLNIDLHKAHDLQRLSGLGGRLIWMAPPRADGIPDNSLTRIQLQNKARALRWGLQQPRLSYVSTSGVYGDNQGRWIDELTPRKAESERAKRRLSDENQLLLGSQRGWASIHILRAPGIYGDERLPVDRLRARQPAILSHEDSWSNHIHEKDLARLAYWAQLKGSARYVVNACDAHPMRMGDYFDLVAENLGLEKPPRVSRQEAQSQVSPMMWSFMRESRQIRSLRQHTIGFQLKYPSVAAYFKARTQSA